MSRRDFLTPGATLTGSTFLAHATAVRAAEQTRTKALIVIAGAGAAGLAAAAQLANRLDGAEITIFDARGALLSGLFRARIG